MNKAYFTIGAQSVTQLYVCRNVSVFPSTTESQSLNQISELHQFTLSPPSDDSDSNNDTTMHSRMFHSNGSSRKGSLAQVNSNSSTGLNKIPESQALSIRRPSVLLQEILSTRRPSAIMHALTRPNPSHSALVHNRSALFADSFHEGGSSRSVNIVTPPNGHSGDGRERQEMADIARRKNRRTGDDALTGSLSALYAKLVVILGCALPITQILSTRIPPGIYQGFYLYLYLGSIAFVLFVYATHMKSRAVSSLIKSYQQKINTFQGKKRVPHFGSFYLRVGAIAFCIGNMVYSGLEIGRYFEIHPDPRCKNFTMILTPICRMILSIFQMQFIFLNTVELDMGSHKVIARFGLMHMVATNLCEWLYVLVEETKHEIFHLSHHDADHSAGHSADHSADHTNGSHFAESLMAATTTIASVLTGNNETNAELIHDISKRSIMSTDSHCYRTNIMGNLVQNVSPFLFPCTIEWSLICAVILFEMWKQIRSLPEIERSRRNSVKLPHPSQMKKAHHFSVDCSRAHRGMFAGILVIVLTIISLIMYFVLHKEPEYELLAMQEVTICEIILYTITSAAVIWAMLQMRDMKYHRKVGGNDHHAETVALDCTLLILAQTGGYIYGMFSIIGCFFAIQDGHEGATDGFFAEILSLVQTSLQTLFVLNVSWRRCRGQKQNREKPGREIVTFLLVANMALWFINTLVKGHAGFRHTHIDFYGMWAWTVITHISMPLAIFYRFHSTICLFEIWKSAYKFKADHH